MAYHTIMNKIALSRFHTHKKNITSNNKKNKTMDPNETETVDVVADIGNNMSDSVNNNNNKDDDNNIDGKVFYRKTFSKASKRILEQKVAEKILSEYDTPDWAQEASKRILERKVGDKSLSEYDVPEGISRILLHSCCAPCSGAMVEEMLSYSERTGLEVAIFFYNPNIHPKREYEIRKEENKKFANSLGVEFVDCDYDTDNWYARMKGLEFDPERGSRCTECFDMRMERTALYAHEHGFDAIATTNATSRWKDAKQVDESGFRAASFYDGLQYWHRDWQTDGMTLRKYQISAENRFYKQEYCGCSYSLRDSNEWRRANGIPNIKIGGSEAGLGNRYFMDPIEDAKEESQDVVDEFFSQAQEIAEAGSDRAERKKVLEVYKDRRKNEKETGVDFGLNNW